MLVWLLDEDCLYINGMGTGQEQDCAWGNGMDMGTGMKTRLNQILNNVLNTYIRDSFGAIVTLCRFDLRRV
jgi:hypothetical protein